MIYGPQPLIDWASHHVPVFPGISRITPVLSVGLQLDDLCHDLDTVEKSGNLKKALSA